MLRRTLSAAVVVLALAATGAAGAGKPGDPPASSLGARPIEITADRLDADSGKESVVVQGNVVAVQGDVTLQADKLFAEYSRKSRAIEKITAEGNVHVAQGDRKANAERAVFYNIEQKIVLTGKAELVQGENDLKGETVTIFLRENRSVITGGEGGERIRAVIYPQKLETGKEKESP
jgi:lipopolysaccharide export system protein LptA